MKTILRIRREFIYSLIISIIACFFLNIVLQYLNHFYLTRFIIHITTVFLSLMIFVVVWFTYEGNPTPNHILCFGFFIAAFMMIPYISFWDTNMDLALKFGILVTFIEAIVLLIFSFNSTKLAINKWVGLGISVLIILASYYFIIKYNHLLPSFYTADGKTLVKNIIEFACGSIYLLNIIYLMDKIDKKEFVNYKWIYIGVILAGISSFIFVIGKYTNSFLNDLATVFRVAYFYFLFRGIIINAIIYPYEKLKSNHKYIAEILDSLPTGVTTLNKDFKITYLNNKSLELLGNLERSEIEKYSTKEFLEYFSIDNMRIKALLRDLKIKKEIKNTILEIKNGKNKINKLSVDLYYLNDDGYLFLYDETRKVQALENFQLQTQTILDSISSSVMIYDTDYKIKICNKSYEQLLGLDVKDILNSDLQYFNTKINYSNSEVARNIIANHGEKKIYEATVTTADGSERNLLVQEAPIYNVDGELIGGVGVGADITNQKKEQAQMLQQEKLALLGEMAAGIIHEVRNPLTSILGFSQLISLKCDDENLKKYAYFIEKESKDLNRIVTDFLSFAKPKTPVLIEMSPITLIESVKMLIESTSFIKGMNATYEHKADGFLIKVDANQIKQVILNIVKNAMEAMLDTESPELKVITGYYSGTDECYITINNNGKLIPEEDLKMIGTPFFTQKEKGTGLGLSISMQIMKEHNGRIDIKSEAEQGTSFTLLFPACQKPIE